MSATARSDWNSDAMCVANEMVLPAPVEETAMREKLNVVRDTMLVFGLQIVFRATMLFRRLNF